MLIDFLKTKRSKEELKTTLAVIREFKELESVDEWVMPFSQWVRLEQLEEYLAHLVDGTELADDTQQVLKTATPPNY